MIKLSNQKATKVHRCKGFENPGGGSMRLKAKFWEGGYIGVVNIFFFFWLGGGRGGGWRVHLLGVLLHFY